MVKHLVIEENKKELVLQMKNYKKIDYRDYERRPFQISDYFKTMKMADSRIMLRYKLSMIQSVRNNQRSNKKFHEANYECIDCAEIGIHNITDTQDHLLSPACQANSDLRSGLNLDLDENICSFFRALIERRKERYGC